LIDELSALLPADAAGNAAAEKYRAAARIFRGYIDDWSSHPASIIKREVARSGFIDFHLERARHQVEELSRDDFQFHAFPDLELSTQLLLKAAVRRGVQFDLLDRRENFIRLRRGAKEEWVMQATKTSLDRYSRILAMENKKVTKLLLAEKGIAVPDGTHFTDIELAKAAW